MDDSRLGRACAAASDVATLRRLRSLAGLAATPGVRGPSRSARARRRLLWCAVAPKVELGRRRGLVRPRTSPTPTAAIAEPVELLPPGRGRSFEWKHHGYDRPADLTDAAAAQRASSPTTRSPWSSARSTRARAAGAAPRAPDRLDAAPAAARTRRAGRRLAGHQRPAPRPSGTSDSTGLADGVRGRATAADAATARRCICAVADDGTVVCAAWMRLPRRAPTSPRCGAAARLRSTAARGIYKVAGRPGGPSEAAERGFRYLQVDASDRQPADPRAARAATWLTTTTPCRYWQPVSRSLRHDERLVVVGGDAAGMIGRVPGQAAARRRPRGRRARARPLHVVLRLRHPLLDRRRGRRRSTTWSPARRRSTGPTASTCGCAPRRRRSTWTGARSRSATTRSGRTYRLGFDQLVIATGARPARGPTCPGIDADGVFGVQTLDDGQAVLDGAGAASRAEAVVVGGGYIGVEMAEAMVNRGLAVTVVDRARPSRWRRSTRTWAGWCTRPWRPWASTCARGVDRGRRDRTTTGGSARSLTDAGELAADLVVLGHRRRARDVAGGARRAAAGPLGRAGHRPADARLRRDGVWAAGDCVETIDLVAGNRVHVPLGTHANKQGRVLGTNLGGGYATFPGVVGTAVSKVCDLEIARTGLREQATRRGRLPVSHGQRSSRPPAPATSRTRRR